MSFQTLDLMTQEISMLVALSRTLLFVYLPACACVHDCDQIRAWMEIHRGGGPSELSLGLLRLLFSSTRLATFIYSLNDGSRWMTF